MNARNIKGMPQYLLIAESIRGWIQTGRYKAGDSISTIEELAAEFNVAKGTVQEAIRYLSEDGIIISARGRRSKVGKVPEIRPVFSAIEAGDSLLIERVGKSDNKLLSSKVITPERDLAKRLGLKKGQLLVESTWLLYLNKEPNAYGVMHTDGGSRSSPIEPFQSGELPESVSGSAKRAARAERRVAATSADLELCKLLSVPVGSPILRYSCVLWAANKELLINMTLFLRSDSREYALDV